MIVDHLTTKNWRRNWAVHRTWGDHLSELWLGQHREQSVQSTLAAASGILDTAATACFVADELIKRCSASSPTCREPPRRAAAVTAAVAAAHCHCAALQASMTYYSRPYGLLASKVWWMIGSSYFSLPFLLRWKWNSWQYSILVLHIWHTGLKGTQNYLRDGQWCLFIVFQLITKQPPYYPDFITFCFDKL